MASKRQGKPGGWAAVLWLWRGGALVIVVTVAAAGASSGALAAWLRSAPAIEAFENYAPPEATVLYDRDGNRAGEWFVERRRVVDLDELPPHVPDAFLAIEDAGFRQHVGIDPRAIVRATVRNAAKGRLAQGASTVTQQLPRNLLPDVGREKTWRRKLRETLIALQLETRYTKDQILEVYLNQIYLGAGTYGIEAAAQLYFGKPAGELGLAEAALLAGLPQAPERYSPRRDADRAVRRRDQVLGRMYELGWITGEEFDAAVTEVPRFAPARGGHDPEFAPYLDLVRLELGSDPALASLDARGGGLRIDTAMDPRLQRLAVGVLADGLAAQEAVWIEGRRERWRAEQRDPDRSPPTRGQQRMARLVRRFPGSIVVELPGGWRADLDLDAEAAPLFAGLGAGDGIDIEVEGIKSRNQRLFEGRLLPTGPLQGALVCVDARSGHVVAVAAGRGWGVEGGGGFFNRAVSARRQAGSTFKPFLFASALRRGLTPWDVFVDEPVVFADGYAPRNYENRFFGRTTVQEAMETSRNTVAVMLAQRVGVRRFAREAAAFHRVPVSTPWELDPVLPLALGACGITPLDAAAAYVPFANGGRAPESRAVTRVRNAAGRTVHRPGPEVAELLRPREAAFMAQMLAGVMTHGTGRSIRETLPPRMRDHVAGKTGTTNDNRDAWFVGFTRDYVAAVWVGFDRPLPLAKQQTGGRTAGAIWADFMSLADPDPAGLGLPPGWAWITLDAETGHPVRGTSPGGPVVRRAVDANDPRLSPDWQPPQPVFVEETLVEEPVEAQDGVEVSLRAVGE